MGSEFVFYGVGLVHRVALTAAKRHFEYQYRDNWQHSLKLLQSCLVSRSRDRCSTVDWNRWSQVARWFLDAF
jgi:hypothetical protein